MTRRERIIDAFCETPQWLTQVGIWLGGGASFAVQSAVNVPLLAVAPLTLALNLAGGAAAVTIWNRSRGDQS